MILENIRDFDWINEPANVCFTENGMQITTWPGTDFWQNIDNHFSKDDGHFFFRHTQGDFIIEAQWFFERIKDAAQCGIMIRFDERNWIKLGLLSQNIYSPQLGVIVANKGSCDWSIIDLPEKTNSIRLKIKKCGRDFVSYYLNDQKYQVVRMTHLPLISDELKVGVYACSPKEDGFECVLEELNLQKL